jgi:Rifampin ADP-ribosyl transferase
MAGKITPMADTGHLNPVQFYHGTNTELSPGTVLKPGEHEPSYFHGPESHVYMSTNPDIAHTHAKWRTQQHGGAPAVYQVSPGADVETDWPGQAGKYEHRAGEATVINKV